MPPQAVATEAANTTAFVTVTSTIEAAATRVPAYILLPLDANSTASSNETIIQLAKPRIDARPTRFVEALVPMQEHQSTPEEVISVNPPRFKAFRRNLRV
jgi:hypothetical protein